jgi:curved DNA-binding protein CbpA
MAQFIDYYKILQVDPSAEPDIIEAAYIRLSKLYHPDVNKDPGAEEKYKEITEAYFVLKDPNNRSKYDIIYKNFYKPRPKPEVDKSYILFDNVAPGETKTGSFVLRNSGGDYENIDVSVQSPNSWLKITGLNSLNPNQLDELPLRIEIEASADEWDSNYIEYIIVKFDDEEVRIKVELNTKTKLQQQPTFNKKKLIIFLPILFLIIFSCIGINYFINRCSKQNNNVVETTIETEDSYIDENVSSSNDGNEQEVVLKEFDFNGKVAYFKYGFEYANYDDRSLYIIDGKNNNETAINLEMYWHQPITKYLSWSPDGTRIAIGFGMDLYIINILDSSMKKIYSLETERVDDEDTVENRGYFEAISWSPDGKNILLTVSPGETQGFLWKSEEQISNLVTNKIVLIDCDGDNEKVILESYDSRYLGLAWSNDGSKIVYSTGRGMTWEEYCEPKIPFSGNVALWIINVNNNFKNNQIADFTGWTNAANHKGKYISHCSWSPDDNKILFDLLDSGCIDEKSMIYIIDSNGENPKEFIKGYSPNYSLDGGSIIYGQYNEEDDNESIILLNNETLEAETITLGNTPTLYSLKQQN